MKNFILMILGFFLASIANAKEICIQFPTNAVSKNLKTISLVLTIDIKKPDVASGIVTAKRTEARWVQTPFDCQAVTKKWVCSQPQGAGDFILQLNEDGGKLLSAYLNLLIGSTKGIIFNNSMTINEEFALFKSEDEFTEEELEHERPKIFSLSGQLEKCSEKK